MQKSVFKRYLAHMTWSSTPVLDWGDLTYLLLDQYNSQLVKLLQTAKIWDQPITTRRLAESTPNQVCVTGPCKKSSDRL
jgi:hypothetical protein